MASMKWDAKTYREKNLRRLKWLKSIKTWQLVILLLLGLVATATFFRINSLGMMERRHAVVLADDSGDKEALKKSLTELQSYVLSHMNTDLGNGFFLTKTYDRDYDAAINQAQDSSNPNSSVYQTASVECRALWQGGRESFRDDYVRCVIDRAAAVPSQENLESTMTFPDPNAYRISYASPLWSFDLAGLGTAFCLLIIMVIVLRVTGAIVLKVMLKRRFSNV